MLRQLSHCNALRRFCKEEIPQFLPGRDTRNAAFCDQIAELFDQRGFMEKLHRKDHAFRAQFFEQREDIFLADGKLIVHKIIVAVGRVRQRHNVKSQRKRAFADTVNQLALQ